MSSSAFLWACLIVAVLLGMMAGAEVLSQAVQPLSEAIIGEPMEATP